MDRILSVKAVRRGAVALAVSAAALVGSLTLEGDSVHAAALISASRRPTGRHGGTWGPDHVHDRRLQRGRQTRLSPRCTDAMSSFPHRLSRGRGRRPRQHVYGQRNRRHRRHTVTLAAGESITYTVVATIDAAATGTLVNTASVTVGGRHQPLNDNTFTDTDTLTQADLSITKTDGTTTAAPGGIRSTYTITASNAGPGR